jgi:hypothetical protein
MILSLGLMLVGQRLLNPHPRQQDELPVRRGSWWRVRVLALERVVHGLVVRNLRIMEVCHLYLGITCANIFRTALKLHI